MTCARLLEAAYRVGFSPHHSGKTSWQQEKKPKNQNASWSWQAISVFGACIGMRGNPGFPFLRHRPALASPLALVCKGVCESFIPWGGRAGRCCISLEISLSKQAEAGEGERWGGHPPVGPGAGVCWGLPSVAVRGGGTTSFAEIESARCTMEQSCSFSPLVFAAQTLGFSASASIRQKCL